MKLPTLGLMACALCGCTSYEVRSNTRFVDELGRFAMVEYCMADEDHVTTFVSPVNGRELEMRSKLLVNVDLYDDYSFRAWQVINFESGGTKYATDDGEWMFFARGFTCEAYRLNEETGRYDTKFQGVICRDEGGEKEESKWRKIKPVQTGVRRPAKKKK